MHQFIECLDIPAEDKERLLVMTPASYTGIASTLVSHIQE
jgi:adenylosuccinate lyase